MSDHIIPRNAHEIVTFCFKEDIFVNRIMREVGCSRKRSGSASVIPVGSRSGRKTWCWTCSSCLKDPSARNTNEFCRLESVDVDFGSDVLLQFVPVRDEHVFSPTSSCVQGVSNEDVRQYLNTELMLTMFVFFWEIGWHLMCSQKGWSVHRMVIRIFFRMVTLRQPIYLACFADNKSIPKLFAINLQRDLTVAPKQKYLLWLCGLLFQYFHWSQVDMEWMCRETMPIRRKLWQIPVNFLCRLFLFWGPEEGIVEDFSSCHVRFCFGWDMLESDLRINPAPQQRNDDAVSTHCPHSEFFGLRKQCQQTFWQQTLDQFWHQGDVCAMLWRSLSFCTLRNSDLSENVQTHRGCSQTCLIFLVFVRLQVRGEWLHPFSLTSAFSELGASPDCPSSTSCYQSGISDDWAPEVDIPWDSCIR